jgi:membrane-associated protein
VLALFDIQKWLDQGGVALAGLIIFAETGLLIGFFLPGDSLLFVAGFLSSKPKGLPSLPSIGLVIPVLVVAAFIGTHEFFERHGTKALVMARFVPIVRTFVPVLAGVGEMDHRTFMTANAIGALLWAGGVTMLGYFLGQVDVIKNNIEVAAILVVAISLLPVAIEYRRHRRAARAGSASHD